MNKNDLVSKREVFIHLHIPKCGGTTISDFLKRNFGSKLLLTNSVLNDYQYNSVQVEKIIDHWPGIECISGHRLSANLPYYRNDLKLVSFTWVRDPIKRFVSHYFYHRNHTTKVPEAKSMDLLEYTDWALNKGNQPMYINGQVRFLCGGVPNFDHLKRLINEDKLLVFPLPEMEKSFQFFANEYSDVFKDTRIKTKNISKKDQEIPLEVLNIIRHHVAEDLELQNLAFERLSNIKAYGVGNLGLYQRVLNLKKDALMFASFGLRGMANRLDKLL